MLIVSSLDGAANAYAAYRPARVISVLAGDEKTPGFRGLDAKRHLKLCVEQESCARSIDDAARRRAEELVDFIKTWDGKGDILIHCSRGVSRSTAAAFVIMCMRQPQADEKSLAAALRRAAPFADPCPLLVSYSDDLLGRDGRMIDAVEDLPLPSPTISAPVVTLPLAA